MLTKWDAFKIFLLHMLASVMTICQNIFPHIYLNTVSEESASENTVCFKILKIAVFKIKVIQKYVIVFCYSMKFEKKV